VKMEAAWSSETSVHHHISTQCQNPEHSDLNVESRTVSSYLSATDSGPQQMNAKSNLKAERGGTVGGAHCTCPLSSQCFQTRAITDLMQRSIVNRTSVLYPPDTIRTY
jgi:hypothetical protein